MRDNVPDDGRPQRQRHIVSHTGDDLKPRVATTLTNAARRIEPGRRWNQRVFVADISKAKRRLDWALPDPKHLPLEGFREVRDRIETLVTELLRDISSRDRYLIYKKGGLESCCN